MTKLAKKEVFTKPGRVGIAYHSFRMHAMNLRECGTSEMDGKVLTLNEGMGSDLDRLSENAITTFNVHYILSRLK